MRGVGSAFEQQANANSSGAGSSSSLCSSAAELLRLPHTNSSLSSSHAQSSVLPFQPFTSPHEAPSLRAMSEYGSDDDHAGGYTLEEYNVGPTQQQQAAEEKSNIDFRMDAPPPSMGGGSMESRFKAAGEMQPPEGMELARPSPNCCGGASSNTGPKAVKADYEAAKQILRDQRMRENLRRERLLEPQKLVALSDLTMTAEEKAMLDETNKASDEDSDEESDSVAFRAYRASRIAAVQNSLPRFGAHTRVGKLEFANLVKNVHELVYVVCHIYQNSNPACARLNMSLESLAPQFPHVRFVRLRSREAMAGFSNAGLPALLVYKGGQMVTSAVRATDPLPSHFSDVDVARLLQAKGILTVPTGLTESASRLRDETQGGREWSDDECNEAEAENKGGAMPGGFNLIGDLASAGAGSSAPSTSSNSQRVGGSGKLKKGQISRRRAAESGSDSD